METSVSSYYHKLSIWVIGFLRKVCNPRKRRSERLPMHLHLPTCHSWSHFWDSLITMGRHWHPSSCYCRRQRNGLGFNDNKKHSQLPSCSLLRPVSWYTTVVSAASCWHVMPLPMGLGPTRWMMATKSLLHLHHYLSHGPKRLHTTQQLCLVSQNFDHIYWDVRLSFCQITSHWWICWGKTRVCKWWRWALTLRARHPIQNWWRAYKCWLTELFTPTWCSKVSMYPFLVTLYYYCWTYWTLL